MQRAAKENVATAAILGGGNAIMTSAKMSAKPARLIFDSGNLSNSEKARTWQATSEIRAGK